MRKVYLLIAAVAIGSLALDKITIPQRASSGAVILASKYNENLDTIANKVNRIVDTVKSVQITTDSLYELKARIDTLSSGKITATTVDINGGAVDGVVIGGAVGGAAAATVTTLTATETASVDSLFSAKGIKATTGTFSGAISGAGISGTTGAFSSTVTVDSLKSTKQVEANLKGNVTGNVTGDVTGTADSAKGAHHLTGGAVSATTVNASGLTTLDSVYTPKGIKGAVFNGPLVGNVTGDVTGTADSAKGAHHLTGGAVSATTITASSTSNLDSLSVTKGATIGGNVGIGTTSPSTTLHVNGMSTIQAGIAGATTTSDVSGLFKFIDYGTNQSNTSTGLSLLRETAGLTEGTGSLFEVRYGNSSWTNATSAFKIGHSGNVGIGTTSPAAKLDVNGHALTSTFKTGACTTTTIKASSTSSLDSAYFAKGIKVDGPALVSGDIYSVKSTDYSSTSTVSGWSGYSSKIIYYKKIGKTVFVYFYIDGTSNSTSTSFTLPYSAAIANIIYPISYSVDYGLAIKEGSIIMITGSTANCYKYDVSGWTAANTKIISGQFFYETND